MIVNTLIKILFFYFIFVLIRNVLRGASKVNQVKKHMREQMDQMNGGARHQQQSAQSSAKASSSEDIVEAEFRHL